MNFSLDGITVGSYSIGALDLLTAAAFALIGAAVFLFFQAYRRLQNDPIRERLAAAAGEPAWMDGRPSALTESLAAQIPQTRIDNGILDQDLRRAGYYKPTARNEYLAIRNSMVIAAVIIAGILAVFAGPERQQLSMQILIGGVAVACLAWGLPRIYLKMQGAARVRRIQRSLPDALDMITMCLTGGLSLQDSLTHVSRELYFAHPDLAVELLIVRQQADMTSLEQAFHQFSRRIDTPEIQSMTALMAHSQRLGTDVVNPIRDYADGVRLKRRQTADERASKAGVKMLFPLAMCLVPSVFILLWGPAVLELRDFLQNFSIGSFNI